MTNVAFNLLNFQTKRSEVSQQQHLPRVSERPRSKQDKKITFKVQCSNQYKPLPAHAS